MRAVLLVDGKGALWLATERLLGLLRRVAGHGDLVQPRCDEGLPAQAMRLHVDDPDAAHGCWGGDLEVHRFEHDAHHVGHADHLAALQAELLVIIEDGIHVLDPHGVDGPVEDNPLAVVLLAARHHAVVHTVAVCDRENAVGPLMRDHVKVAIQLPHIDRLWVDHHRVDAIPRPRGLVVVQVGHCLLQHFPPRGLSGKRKAYNHETVADEHHLVDLHDLVEDILLLLQPVLFQHAFELRHDRRVVGLGELHAGEEVARDAVEERNVGGQKLGQVDVDNSAEHEDGLVLLGLGKLEVARGAKHGHDGPHPVVIMPLRGELLGAQGVGRDDLDRERAGVGVPKGPQDDVCNHRVVGNHHRH